ncbi:NAD(P)/FAD-dependent oxidoreductase [Pseudomonas sp. LP_7_YM]|uniref:NAD(P)/FAD-dependent oxidoreductase n=1 Tax=Pseudomonas sp. LP_7_YM TaxID=2485137 RepID=UPI00105D3446|nr:FAD-dependent oxidoreductase [Pseudomonas sp. LP_7_YM]TDV72783.1 3-phenylpropionate/trans-cinnamate dioxygenase ferredoxin reductase subunit [Pseudomonas sp. LP_7_YM]
MSPSDTLVIVGAGHAGGRAALTLREAGFAGRIVLIGDEAHLPYERPPLSKALLKGESSLASCSLFSEASFLASGIEHLSQVRVTGIDTARHCVALDTGASLVYSKLLLAIGGTSRRLDLAPGQLGNVRYLRTFDEAVELEKSLKPDTRLVVVGGGFIGLEVACSARDRGCEVTVLEAGQRLAARALPERVSEALLTLHRRKGVVVRLGAQIEAFRGEDRVQSVQLASGEQVPCDILLVGIGMQPNLQLARQAGLETGSGIKVDAFLQTSAEDVYAAGDVCEFTRGDGAFHRQETWRNAEAQGRVAALNMLGQQQLFDAVPGFWSDHYEFGLQTVGTLAAEAQIIERAGVDGGFLLLYLDRQSRLAGASGWGAGNSIAKDMKLCERLIESRAVLPVEQLSDASVSLKGLLRGAHV